MTTEMIETNPTAMISQAIEKGIDTVTIGKMLDLQERWEATQAHKAFVAAMSAFKKECPSVIGKDRKADFGAGKAKYSYATTSAIVTAITPALSKNGLHLSWETRQDGNQVTVTCHVTHEKGHRESAPLTGPLDASGGKNPIQMLGSSVHYLQRYTMVSVLGLATADMDDPDAGDTRPPITMPKETGAAASMPVEVGSGNVQTPMASVESAPVESVCGLVQEVTEKATATGKMKYGIKVNGEWYGTFSKTAADVAHEAKQLDKQVVIEWVASGKWRNLATIEQI